MGSALCNAGKEIAREFEEAIMLRKRTRSTQKGQLTSDYVGSDGCCGLQNGVGVGGVGVGVAGQKQKTSSLFNVPGLFIGLAPPNKDKGVTDCDSVRSPTSPLDLKVLSNLGSSSSSFRSPSPRWCSHEHKVGLGSIVDSLDGKLQLLSGSGGKVMGSTNSKSILFGPQIRTKTPPSPPPSAPAHFSAAASETPKSLPNNCAINFPHTHRHLLKSPPPDVLFQIGGEDPVEPPYVFAKFRSFSLDSKSFGSHIYGYRSDPPLGSASVEEEEEEEEEEDSPTKTKTKTKLVGVGASPNLEDTSPFKLSSSAAAVVVGFGCRNAIVGHLSPSEIELSEDYTCVISHGPNPKTTYIYCDCILESHAGEGGDYFRNTRVGISKMGEKSSNNSYPTDADGDDFLSFCYFCKKKLEEGKDIYMYRGEKAFCSSECRAEQILIEEGKDKSVVSEAPPKEVPRPTDGEEEDNFDKGMFVAI